jgi:sterol desaturase/sphingolipid hydroxylase (fatty acid hydroxylase superfamily)
MHVWHHDHDGLAGRRFGVNFAVCLSLWDWIFGTAYWPSREDSPEQQPRRLGFRGEEKFPRSLWGRFFHPLTRLLAGARSESRSSSAAG